MKTLSVPIKRKMRHLILWQLSRNQIASTTRCLCTLLLAEQFDGRCKGSVESLTSRFAASTQTAEQMTVVAAGGLVTVGVIASCTVGALTFVTACHSGFGHHLKVST